MKGFLYSLMLFNGFCEHGCIGCLLLLDSEISQGGTAFRTA